VVTSLDHEAFTELFRNRPSLAAELLAGMFGVDLPAWRHARLDSGDLTDLVPTEHRADGVLVVCVDDAVASWCRQPITVGHPGWVLTPLVLGPEQVPPVTDPELARRWPELAVMSAMTHGATHIERDRIYRALLDGLEAVDDDQATLYHDVVMAVLPEAARRHLEALMASRLVDRYHSEFARKYVKQGLAEDRAEGEARALLTVLAARGIKVPDDLHDRITGCTDLDQLDTWISRAGTATSIDEVFA
jgi:hypothetical protein